MFGQQQLEKLARERVLNARETLECRQAHTHREQCELLRPVERRIPPHVRLHGGLGGGHVETFALGGARAHGQQHILNRESNGQMQAYKM